VLWRRQRLYNRQPDERAAVDYGAASGRHRLSDGDVVPAAGHRRYADILRDQPTKELPVVPIRMTPGREPRSRMVHDPATGAPS
jgi:hypothetical protein